MSSDDDDYFVDENGDDGYRIIGGGLHGSDDHFAPVELPEPTLSTLKNILSLVSVDSMYTKEGVRASIIQNPVRCSKSNINTNEWGKSCKCCIGSNILTRIHHYFILLPTQSYLDKLFDVFEMAESMKDTESLHMLYSIFKHIGSYSCYQPYDISHILFVPVPVPVFVVFVVVVVVSKV